MMICWKEAIWAEAGAARQIAADAKRNSRFTQLLHMSGLWGESTADRGSRPLSVGRVKTPFIQQWSLYGTPIFL
jgi:hypothetical protein